MKKLIRLSCVLVVLATVMSIFAATAFADTCSTCNATIVQKCVKSTRTYSSTYNCGTSSDCTYQITKCMGRAKCSGCGTIKSYGTHKEAELHYVTSHSRQYCTLSAY